MPRFLTDGANSYNLTGYITVMPFQFNAEGQLELRPQHAILIAHLASMEIKSDKRPRESNALSKSGNFEIHDDSGAILSFDGFQMISQATPTAVDMTQGYYCFRGPRQAGVAPVRFAPRVVAFNLFNNVEGDTHYWGGRIKEPGNPAKETVLNLSYSSPLYDMSVPDHRLVNYYGHGPAGSTPDNAHRGSIFAWVVGRGAAAHLDSDKSLQPTATDALPELAIVDLSHNTDNRLFGQDKPGVMQVTARTYGETSAAVFVANGIFSGLPAPSLKTLVDRIASASSSDQKAVRLVDDLPANPFDVTGQGAATKNDVAAAANLARISTPDIEGIAVWNLSSRGGDVVDQLHR